MISLFKIRVLGLLWCEGNDVEKAHEFYNMLQGSQPTIACSDKDFKPNLFTLFDMASDMTLELAPKYTKTPKKVTFTIDKEQYEDLSEIFLDEVFGNESKLEQWEWVEGVSERQNYLFDPKKIRKELGIN